MEEDTEYYYLGNFYLAVSRLSSFIGVAFTCAYISEVQMFQIMLHIGTLAISVGYDFNKN